MVPQPVYAVLLCFPISENSEKHRAEEEQKIAKDGQPDAKNVYHMNQTVGNACGTIGLIHAVLNNADILGLDKDKFFAKFLKDTKSMSAAERAAALEANTDIESSHQSVANDSEAKSNVNDKTNVNLHFIVFVCVDNYMWELDGRKKRPICHGKSSLQSLLYDSVGVVSQFMARDPKDLRFNMAALTPMLDFD
jgi:ubiquitin carboxyl-terminal hydrolase L3